MLTVLPALRRSLRPPKGLRLIIGRPMNAYFASTTADGTADAYQSEGRGPDLGHWYAEAEFRQSS
jgi:hypothetical protein